MVTGTASNPLSATCIGRLVFFKKICLVLGDQDHFLYIINLMNMYVTTPDNKQAAIQITSHSGQHRLDFCSLDRLFSAANNQPPQGNMTISNAGGGGNVEGGG
jgi:hypothetical protein